MGVAAFINVNHLSAHTYISDGEKALVEKEQHSQRQEGDAEAG